MGVDERAMIRESCAFEMLAMRHPRAALHVAAIVQPAKGVPGYAWVQCLDCSADFDLERDADWHLTDESEAVLECGLCISAHAYVYGN
jgi:hypothetical protein